MVLQEKKSTGLHDKNGNLLYENDKCKSWHLDETHPAGGYWMIEEIKFHNNDWYLFERDHDYITIDDQPVLLLDHLDEIERIISDH